MTHPTKAIIPLMLEDARKIEERDAKKIAKASKQNYGGMGSQQKQGHDDESRSYGFPYGDTPMESSQKSESNMFEPGRITKEMINRCIRRCQTIQLHETMEINGIKLKAYYAGHVLGAVMFYIEYNGIS